METTELIKKAHEIASKKLNVTYINAEESISFTDNSMIMGLTIFYIKQEVEKNFSVQTYSFQDEYTCEALIQELTNELERL